MNHKIQAAEFEIREITVSSSPGIKKACLVIFCLLVAVISQTAGCSDMKLGGKTAREVFQNPQAAALVDAGCNGDIARMDVLVRRGVDVNAIDNRGGPILWWIFACKNYAGVEKLLSLGANPNYKVDGTDSATWASAAADDPRWLPLMLAHGGNPNIWSGAQSALMVAIQYNRTENFQTLLDHGANVNAHDVARNSAATDAAGEKNMACLLA